MYRGDKQMTHEEFYGAALTPLRQTEALLLDRIKAYADSEDATKGLKSIVYYCSRIKSPQSVLKKCRLRGFDADIRAALENLYDLVGIRVICAFSADVYHIAEWLRAQPGIEVVQEKDYYAAPKPNGYRSYHFLLRVPSTGMQAENSCAPSPQTSGRRWSTRSNTRKRSLTRK